VIESAARVVRVLRFVDRIGGLLRGCRPTGAGPMRGVRRPTSIGLDVGDDAARADAERDATSRMSRAGCHDTAP
jgi:hypothetical protein